VIVEQDARTERIDEAACVQTSSSARDTNYFELMQRRCKKSIGMIDFLVVRGADGL
jgi:hypothetical protein